MPDAIAALHAICRDEKAPAPARATAAGWLARMSGLTEKPEAPGDDSEALSEAELEDAIARLKAHAAALDEEDARAKETPAKTADAGGAEERPADARNGPRKDADGLFD